VINQDPGVRFEFWREFPRISWSFPLGSSPKCPPYQLKQCFLLIRCPNHGQTRFAEKTGILQTLSPRTTSTMSSLTTSRISNTLLSFELRFQRQKRKPTKGVTIREECESREPSEKIVKWTGVRIARMGDRFFSLNEVCPLKSSAGFHHQASVIHQDFCRRRPLIPEIGLSFKGFFFCF
jgi:hypothetical protein